MNKQNQKLDSLIELQQVVLSKQETIIALELEKHQMEDKHKKEIYTLKKSNKNLVQQLFETLSSFQKNEDSLKKQQEFIARMGKQNDFLSQSMKKIEIQSIKGSVILDTNQLNKLEEMERNQKEIDEKITNLLIQITPKDDKIIEKSTKSFKTMEEMHTQTLQKVDDIYKQVLLFFKQDNELKQQNIEICQTLEELQCGSFELFDLIKKKQFVQVHFPKEQHARNQSLYNYFQKNPDMKKLKLPVEKLSETHFTLNYDKINEGDLKNMKEPETNFIFASDFMGNFQQKKQVKKIKKKQTKDKMSSERQHYTRNSLAHKNKEIALKRSNSKSSISKFQFSTMVRSNVSQSNITTSVVSGPSSVAN